MKRGKLGMRLVILVPEPAHIINSKAKQTAKRRRLGKFALMRNGLTDTIRSVKHTLGGNHAVEIE